MFLTRYTDDSSRPRTVTTDLARRVALPGVLLWAVVVAVGALLEGPLSGLASSEESLNESLAEGRTAAWNTITAGWSFLGNTPSVIAVGLAAVAVIAWRHRQWWYAVVPLIAVALQSTVFILATLVIGRERPGVPQLDPAPPTSSFPSGHVGASTALYWTLALMALRIRSRALRNVAVAICLAIPFLVAYARLYRGMHHVSDVVVGMINGAACALIAWAWVRRADARGRR